MCVGDAADDGAVTAAIGYTEEVNVQFGVFLEEAGFDVAALRDSDCSRRPSASDSC